MSKIKIKNFGPIKEGYKDGNGWIDVKKVTVFIGNQGSGKSTVAKLISTFTWIEKVLTRGDYNIDWFEQEGRFKSYCEYHKIENYFFDINGNDISEIEYKGNSFSIKYKKGELTIKENPGRNYTLPQIIYIPAERNFLSTVDELKSERLSSESLKELLTEFRKAKKEIRRDIQLPINEADLQYDHLKDILYVKGKNYKVQLAEASSGFQSLVPLFLVTWFLANSVKRQMVASQEPMSSDEIDRFKKDLAEIYSSNNLTHEQRRAAISVLALKFNKGAFINIVEEPEQNLFPTSQREILNTLLAFNNLNEKNKLVLTTHSPYMINYLSIAIQGHYLKTKIYSSDKSNELLGKLNEIVPLQSIISSSDIVIYQLDEKDGSIKRLPDFEGIPSDKNYLNQSLAEGNQLFDSLLEIEEELWV